MNKKRTLYFRQVTDSRFTPESECLPELERMIKEIKSLLDLPGVSLKVSEPYKLKWKDHIQYRANFEIQKNTRITTWDDIYQLVNSVKATTYKFRT